ncbi:MAG TPA: FecR domain-containing protein [Candidatus Dormibacteraeota bacterium]|nr:FecR domain-containing protein [Candidatus Dormibacteraeota bacterium]
MRNTRSFFFGLLVSMAAFALVQASAEDLTQGKAKVIRMLGNARFKVGEGPWLPLKAGDIVRPGTVIQTDMKKGSFVDLVLGNGTGSIADFPTSSAASSSSASPVVNYQPKAQQNVIRIWENSALGIDKITTMQTGADTVSDTQLDLKAGHIFGTVKKMSAASKYEVKLPNGVAGIRGTTYDISADGVVKVSDGSVVIAYVAADGTVTTKVVNGGYKFDAKTGEVTPLPQADMNNMRRIEGDLYHFSAASVQTTASATPISVQVIERTHHHGVSSDQNDQGENDNGQGDGQGNQQRGVKQ